MTTVTRRASGAADRSKTIHDRASTAPPQPAGFFVSGSREVHVVGSLSRRSAIARRRMGPHDTLKKMDYSKLDGLVPAVIQDAETGEVLMVGFMNDTALETTRATGFATF